MKVLILSPYGESIISSLEKFNDEYVVFQEPVTTEFCKDGKFDFLISYGYRHIIKYDVLSLFPCKAINLHISLLPYCRGAHPIFWSILEQKPLGVTIHLLDEGLDTGNILFQQVTPLFFDSHESFSSLYHKQRLAIEDLFSHSWRYLRSGECSGWKQRGSPTMHRARDLNDWLGFMPQQWDTSISEFCSLVGISQSLPFKTKSEP